MHPPLQVLVDACDQEQSLERARYPGPPLASSASSPTVRISPAHASSIYPSSEAPHGPVPSPGTEVSVASTRVAPLSWFELLARDASNADSGFLLSPPQRLPQTPEIQGPTPENSQNLQPRSWRERQSFQAAAFPRVPGMDRRFSAIDEESSSSDDSSSWTTSSPIPLSSLERRIFIHFVHFSSQWLDFYDPIKQFSTTVPHLALRNPGLMRALLALTARHISLGHDFCLSANDRFFGHGTEQTSQSEPLTPVVDRNLAVEYYYETLHYLNKAMQHPSYARSHELVATALLISLYEMIDGSNQDWERHLKGVFWIQRFQDNDGESGGLRQAVWWAWIRQDVWVAMRERRRVFSFWQPKKPLPILTAPELATRATWLLGQCVNYASREEQDTTNMPRRLERGSELLHLLQQWHEQLPSEYSSLPTLPDHEIFPAIWVHPPNYAAALQVHSLARILVILHCPSSGGLQDYRAAQKLLTWSVRTICGIARRVDLGDFAANVSSLQCIFGGTLKGTISNASTLTSCNLHQRGCVSPTPMKDWPY